MKILRSILWAATVAVALVGCGGGGDSPGGNGRPLATTAPSNLTLLPGINQQYLIQGGVPPYRATSAENVIAIGAVDGDKLLVGAVNPGQTIVKVLDYANASLDISVTVGSNVPLISTAPENLVIGVGASVARTFYIRGGAAPYTVESSETNVFTVAKISADQFKVQGIAIGSGQITITDAVGTKLTVNVDVRAPELRVSPTELKIFPGVDAVVKISGGQPPYHVAGGIPDAIGATINGDELLIQGKLVSELELAVADATGQVQIVKIEVAAGQAQFGISPAFLRIRDNETSPIKLNIYGAAEGQVCFFTDRPGIRPLACTTNRQVEISAEQISGLCKGKQEKITLTAVDSKGFIGKAEIEVVGTETGTADCP